MTLETAAEFIQRISQPWPSGWRGRRFTTKDIGRGGRRFWTIEALTLMPQGNLPQKVLCIERIRLEKVEGERAYSGGAQVGSREYRFSYFMFGRIGKALDKWTWGQFTPHIPVEDLDQLLATARSEGTLFI